MDKVNIRVLDYIHGLLDEQECKIFEADLEKDSTLKETYHTQLNINEALIQTPLVSAPADLVDKVMSRVQNRKLLTKDNYLSGMRNIIIGSISALGLASLVSYLFVPQSTIVESGPLLEPFLNKLLSSLNSLELIFNNPSVIVMAIAMPILLLLDKSYEKYRKKLML